MLYFQALIFLYHARFSSKEESYFRYNRKQEADRQVPPANHFPPDWEKLI